MSRLRHNSANLLLEGPRRAIQVTCIFFRQATHSKNNSRPLFHEAAPSLPLPFSPPRIAAMRRLRSCADWAVRVLGCLPNLERRMARGKGIDRTGGSGRRDIRRLGSGPFVEQRRRGCNFGQMRLQLPNFPRPDSRAASEHPADLGLESLENGGVLPVAAGMLM